MGSNIYVRTNKYSKSAFMQLLSENGYINVAIKSATADNNRYIFVISPAQKRYTCVVALPTGTDILSVADFVDLFL